MRPMLKRLFSLALAAALLAGGTPARASDALGHDLAARDDAVGAGTELAAGTFWSDSQSDLRQEHYVVYTPSERVTPIVACGGTTRALTAADDAARELEARGWRVVAGINGDYYGVKHGVPLGSTMAEGELRNCNGDPYYAVGFRADGTAIIGDPKLSMHAAVSGGAEFPVFAFNHVRQSGYGIFLYDSRFNDRRTTGTDEPGVDVLCTALEGALTIGGQLTLQVEAVLPETSDTELAEGQYVLTANLSAGESFTAPLLALQPGDRIALSVASGAENAAAWSEVVNLIGAPELLVENGAVREGLPTGSAPRTAIGQRADGALVFYTIDGRRSGYSVGASLTAVGMRLCELGCVTAVALDGGGSTTLVATLPDETAARIVNTPSENAVRPVSNHVFLVASNTPDGTADHVWLAPAAARALPGARVALRAAAVDANCLPLAARGALTLRADRGSVENGELVLPAEPGPVTVTASYGGLSAAATVEVTEPESIFLLRNGRAVNSLTIAPESTVELGAEAFANHLTLPGGSDCFTWTYAGGGVTLTDAHTLIAGADAGAGTLTIAVGGQSLSVPVTVAAVPLQLLDGFESAFEPVTDVLPEPDEGEEPFGELLEPAAPQKARLTLSQETRAAYVKTGAGSARLDYALDGETPATLPLGFSVGHDYDTLVFWALGGGDTLLSVETDAGSVSAAPDALAGEGWRLLSLPLPDGASWITGLTLGADAPASGTLWLDQLVLSYGGKTDGAAPEVSLTPDAEAGLLTGTAFDAANGGSLPTLRLAVDGESLPFVFDARTGALTASLPAVDGLAHQITLTAGDAFGNLSRASLYYPAAADAAPAFPDVAGHWAAGAVDYLRRAGVSNGDDRGRYNPDANITRQEFAVMLYRWAAPEGFFDETKLPFADADAIAPWALTAARAMYALGVVNGAGGSGGKVYYDPQSNITRREAATMLGRLLEKGFAVPELAFEDSGDIPAWAAEHVAVLASLGVFDDFASDEFLPAQPLTRAEMAAMLLRMR